MDKPRNRIIGSEMEWPVLIPNKSGHSRLSDEQTIRIVRECIPDGMSVASRGGMTSNGGRIYRDVTDFIETASPEDTDIYSSVINNIVGERTIVAMLDKAVRRKLIPPSYIVNKRVLDEKGNTWGGHTSFSADPSLEIDARTLMPLGMHLASHNIFAGSGAIWHHGDYAGSNATYALAQKASTLNSDFAAFSHTKDQPLVNLRKEHHATDTHRVHITSMDENMSPWSTWMKYGVTSVVLRMIENGYDGKDLKLADLDMHVFAKRIAADPSLKYTAQFADGTHKSALDVQLALLEHAKSADFAFSEQEDLVIPVWEQTLNDLREDPSRLANYGADITLRKRVIDRAMGKRAVGIDSKVAAAADRAYDDLRVGKSYGLKLREEPETALWMPSEEVLADRFLHGPKSTRAFARGQLIKTYAKDPNLAANWDNVKASNPLITFAFDSGYQREPVQTRVDQQSGQPL